MHEIQHKNQQLWESSPRWGLIARHDNLARCVVGVGRILNPFPGTVPDAPDEYRIVNFDPKGRVRAIFDHTGKKIGGAPEYGNGPKYPAGFVTAKRSKTKTVTRKVLITS